MHGVVHAVPQVGRAKVGDLERRALLAHGRRPAHGGQHSVDAQVHAVHAGAGGRRHVQGGASQAAPRIQHAGARHQAQARHQTGGGGGASGGGEAFPVHAFVRLDGGGRVLATVQGVAQRGRARRRRHDLRVGWGGGEEG